LPLRMRTEPFPPSIRRLSPTT